ncbi:hypothetical protein B0H10DRAFT_2187342 [Mycena sp. CBHHK59/15]|nr:hypothetical protein B0H10DRAFT_2187342 [Mycena sp. CBHHK59/15]
MLFWLLWLRIRSILSGATNRPSIISQTSTVRTQNLPLYACDSGPFQAHYEQAALHAADLGTEKGDLGNDAWAWGSLAVDQDQKIREIHHWKARMVQGSIICAVSRVSGSVLRYYGTVYPNNSCSEWDQLEDTSYALQECGKVCDGIGGANGMSTKKLAGEVRHKTRRSHNNKAEKVSIHSGFAPYSYAYIVRLKTVWKRDTARMLSSGSERQLRQARRELSYQCQLAEMQNIYKIVDSIFTWTTPYAPDAAISGSGPTYYDEELKRLFHLLESLPETIPSGDAHNFVDYVPDAEKDSPIKGADAIRSLPDWSGGSTVNAEAVRNASGRHFGVTGL